ncbi:surface antigen [Amorphus suaedae]
MYARDNCPRYIAPPRRRHPAWMALLASCVVLGGCGIMGPRGEAMFAANEPTGSAEATEALAESSGLKRGDLAALAMALGRDAAGPDDAEARVWDNPAQGTGGRLIDVADVPGPDGHLCRTFKTTVNAPGGLSLLTGIGCRRPDGEWAIDGVATGPGASQG